jgi:hypothetical protein
LHSTEASESRTEYISPRAVPPVEGDVEAACPSLYREEIISRLTCISTAISENPVEMYVQKLEREALILYRKNNVSFKGRKQSVTS